MNDHQNSTEECSELSEIASVLNLDDTTRKYSDSHYDNIRKKWNHLRRTLVDSSMDESIESDQQLSDDFIDEYIFDGSSIETEEMEHSTISS